MTKDEFLRALEGRLTALEPGDRAQHLEYYGEMLSDMMEDGMAETAAVESLGNLDAIAGEILEQMPINQLVRSAVRPKKGWTPLSIVLAVIGSPVWLPIVLVLLALALVIYALVWVAVLCVGVVVLSVFSVAAGCLLAAFSNGFGPLLLLTGGALFCAGAGIFSALGFVWLAKQVVCLTAAMGRGIKRAFMGRRNTL